MTDSIIFDLDGTLWDSTDSVAGAWNCVIAEETDLNKRVTADGLKKLFGKMMDDIAADVFTGETKSRQNELINLCCQEEKRVLLRHPGTLYNGLEDTLKILSKNYRLFIVSNCPAGYIETFLKVTDFSDYFAGHLCPGDTGKAKAANIRAVMDSYGLSSPVYVGDTDGDENASREAGIPFIYASYGFGSAKDPDGIINSPKDLFDVLEQKN